MMSLPRVVRATVGGRLEYNSSTRRYPRPGKFPTGARLPAVLLAKIAFYSSISAIKNTSRGLSRRREAVQRRVQVDQQDL